MSCPTSEPEKGFQTLCDVKRNFQQRPTKNKLQKGRTRMKSLTQENIPKLCGTKCVNSSPKDPENLNEINSEDSSPSSFIVSSARRKSEPNSGDRNRVAQKDCWGRNVRENKENICPITSFDKGGDYQEHIQESGIPMSKTLESIIYNDSGIDSVESEDGSCIDSRVLESNDRRKDLNPFSMTRDDENDEFINSTPTPSLVTSRRESLENIHQIFTSPVDEDKNTELHCRILEKDEIGAFRIIRSAKGFEDLNIPNKLGQTPLHLAAVSGQEKILRKLMSAGGLVSVEDIEGNSPLHIACQNGCLAIVKHLVTPIQYWETVENRYKIPIQAIPQDIHVENDEGYTCFRLAFLSGHTKVLMTLLEYSD